MVGGLLVVGDEGDDGREPKLDHPKSTCLPFCDGLGVAGGSRAAGNPTGDDEATPFVRGLLGE